MSSDQALFKGPSYVALDAKGRLAIPTKYREALHVLAQGQLTITRHPHGCLLIFPRPSWEAFSARIINTTINGQWMKRLFLGYAVDVELDTAGRILIAPEQRAAEGIQKDVILLGMGQYFELWDKQQYLGLEPEAVKAGMEHLPQALQDFAF